MRKAVASLLPIMIACAGACSDRYHTNNTNRNLPPRSTEPSTTKHDLEPNDTARPGTASGPVMTGTTATNTGTGQTSDPNDLKITEDVRSAIMADDTLSTDAKNVTVATTHGVVTLRGAVATEQEKKTLAAKASQIAGVMRVDNRTDVIR